MSLKAIAGHAGIGIASIYHYFPSKDDLLLNLAVLGFDDLRRSFIRYQTLPEFDAPMQATTQAFLTFVAEQPQSMLLMYNERLMARYEVLHQAEQAAFEAFRASVEVDDRFPVPHRTNAALALWALGRGIAAMTSSQPDRRLPAETLDSLLAGASYLINRPD